MYIIDSSSQKKDGYLRLNEVVGLLSSSYKFPPQAPILSEDLKNEYNSKRALFNNSVSGFKNKIQSPFA